MLEALFVLAVLGLGGGAFALASVGPEGAKDPRRLAARPQKGRWYRVDMTAKGHDFASWGRAMKKVRTGAKKRAGTFKIRSRRRDPEPVVEPARRWRGQAIPAKVIEGHHVDVVPGVSVTLHGAVRTGTRGFAQ
jgi:hypothetical protein